MRVMTCMSDAPEAVENILEHPFNAWIGRGCGRWKWLVGQYRDPLDYTGEDGVTFHKDCLLANAADVAASFPAILDDDDVTAYAATKPHKMRLRFSITGLKIEIVKTQPGEPRLATVTATYSVEAWHEDEKEFHQGAGHE